jgi:hypothetical protein
MKVTAKRDRLKAYEEQISKLRLAQTCLNVELAQEAVHALMGLHRKFEREDCGPI